MPETIVTIQHDEGLHARPASMFVSLANRFSSTIKVSCENREANAKSILAVLTLGASKDSIITIQAEGEDADKALTSLKELVANNFEEACTNA